MHRSHGVALLCLACLCNPALAQGPQAPAQPPAQRLPAPVAKAWEKAEKQVRTNRENYDKANARALADFQKALERMNPAVQVDDIVQQFQKDAIVKLDAEAVPPAPPPPVRDIVVFNGHRYKLVEDHLSWDDAQKRCREMGGHLVVIDDRNEQEFISKALQDYRDRHPQLPEGTDVWIGVSKNEAKKWIAVTGREQVYSNWYVLEPRDWFAYARVDLKGQWHSGESTRKQNTLFICEWEM